MLTDFSGAARGAVVDASIAFTSHGVDDLAQVLLEPWEEAEAAAAAGAVAAVPVGRICGHGKPMGKCQFIACPGHFLGGISLDEN